MEQRSAGENHSNGDHKMGKVLVAYFSASGVTAALSKRLAEAIGADLFEIKPETPYTNADLNWTNKASRSSVEMADPASRPAIAAAVDDFQRYDFVFIGFPIWWYREPSIVDTFVEMYDFTGKTIVPFATSGGSGLGDTTKNLHELAPGATVVEGKRFPGNVSPSDLKTWAAQWL
jgi:flavodoxin